MILPVCMEHSPYDIVIERGALAHATEWLDLQRRVLIVTDDGVPSTYAATVASQCASPIVVTLPQGESTKCFDRYRELLRTMADNDFTRRDCVVAVGGGVMGDLAGFAAATYMRGITFYNIPTTLLSMVDSSIGGKVAIDMDGIKNIVGAFHQPRRVLIDPDVLDTLDPRQTRAGLAEAIKMAATSDAEFFSLLEHSLSLPVDTVIERSLRIKKAVVEQDPTEQGLRRVLNFGHTVGHAIESDNHGALLHGECVALGMLPMCSPTVQARLRSVLSKAKLPTDIPICTDTLAPYLKHDKKSTGKAVTTVFVDRIGTFEFRQETVEEILSRVPCITRL